jgi:hypothetical protein
MRGHYLVRAQKIMETTGPHKCGAVRSMKTIK